MLFRYNGKKVRIVTEDGQVFTGKAEAYPAGYGLYAFDRAEESLCLGNTFLFLSDIQSIEEINNPSPPALPRDRYDGLIGRLLEGSCWIVDTLPEQVPRNAPGQYFRADRYFRQPERLAALYRRFAELLLRLNCYDRMAVSFDSCEHWEINPEPEAFVRQLSALPPNGFFRAVFEEKEAMIDLDAGDTWLTLFDPGEQLLCRVRALAGAEGLFLWQAPED